jgi:LAO/AO transport system kinase
MDAAGKDIVFIETVGVGQSEVDIVKAADTTVVVLVPGLGDDIQAIKAGILEIGDIFAINKADRDGAEKLKTELEMMLDLDQVKSGWRPPIKPTVASAGTGIDELIGTIEGHIGYLGSSGELVRRRSARTENELFALIEEYISRHIHKKIAASGQLAALVASIERREKDPYSVATAILADVFREKEESLCSKYSRWTTSASR